MNANANTEQQKINIYTIKDIEYGSEKISVINIYKCDDDDVNEDGETGFVAELSLHADRNAVAVFELPFTFSIYDFPIVFEAVDSAFGWTVDDLLKDAAMEIAEIVDEEDADCDVEYLEGGETMDKNLFWVMMDMAISNFEF